MIKSPTRTEMPEEDRGHQAPELDSTEHHKAEEAKSINADTTFETIRREGEDELERASSSLFWSGLAAGLSMGFSLIAQGMLQSHLPDAPWRPLVAKLGFSVGFVIIVLGSQQLFTHSTVTPVVPALARRTGEAFSQLLRCWGAVLLGNVIGAIIFGVVVAYTTLFDGQAHRAFEDLGREMIRADFATTLLRAVFAGWIVALIVWMLPAAETARVSVVVIMTYLVAIAGFPHIITGSVEVAYLVAIGAVSAGTFLVDFFIPTLLGNTIGGVMLVAALNHAQVSRPGQQGG